MLVRLSKPEAMSEGGLMLPSRQKPCEGEAVALGPGDLNDQTGKLEPLSVAVGAKVVYGKGAFFDKFDIDGLEHGLMREDEVLFSYAGEAPVADTVIMPRGKALIRVAEKKKETASGLLLSQATGSERQEVGTVLAAGDGAAVAGIAVGDLVRFQYGDEVPVKLGGSAKDKHMVVSISEIIAKEATK